MKEKNNIKLTDDGVRAIEALQHSNGTLVYYRSTLNRLYTYILHQSEEIGMSDTEAIHTLRVLDSVRADLEAIAGDIALEIEESPEELAERIDRTFPDTINVEQLASAVNAATKPISECVSPTTTLQVHK